MTYEDNKFRAGGGTLALGIIGTVGAGLLAAGANGNGGLLNGGLFGGGCNWSDREVMLQRQIDALGAAQAVTSAVTPYQIKEATCGMVRAKEYIPANDIVYSSGGCYASNCYNGYTPYCGQ